LLNNNEKVLPPHASTSTLSNEFASFFDHKIKSIYQSFDNDASDLNIVDPLPRESPSCTFANFDLLSETDVLEAITKSPSKSCILDPVPTWFLKQNVQSFLPIITNIINESLSTGVFPQCLKSAIITPIIKKASLNPNDMKNYRPVSNIPFLSKLIEKQAVKMVNAHVVKNNLDEELQSAYKPAHSTETALLKVKADMMSSLSQHKGVFLVLLDLSSAFDTVNHNLLIDRMESELGLKDCVLNWFKSYLSGRTSRVCIDGILSESTKLVFGVPQGSVVGPSAFTFYTLPLGRVIQSYGLSYHMYADDVQLYTSFDPKDPNSIASELSKLSSCIDNIRDWMHANLLKLNDDKTEFFVATSPHLKRKMPPVLLRVGDKCIVPSDTIRNLGVVFDSQMSMSQHIKSLCTSLTFQLRNITRIRRFLDLDTCHLVIRALVLSRLDYGNGLLLGSNKTDIRRLQRMQNWAAKLVCQAPKYDHATPHLRRLHWLPVELRITFKVLVVVFKCLGHTAPAYLADGFSLYRPGRMGLRSASDTTLLTEHSARKTLKSVDDKSFFHAAPRIWNTLPVMIRSSTTLRIFKKNLKTYLYSLL